MYTTQQTNFTVLLPIAITLIISILAGLMFKAEPDRRRDGVILAGVVGAIMTAWLTQFPSPWPLPKDTTRLLPIIVLLSAAAGFGLIIARVSPRAIAHANNRVSSGVAAVVTGVFAALAVAYVTRDARLIALALPMALVTRMTAIGIGSADLRSPSFLASLLISGTTVGAGFVIALTGSLALSQHVMLVGCAATGVLFGSIVLRRNLSSFADQLVVLVGLWVTLANAAAWSKMEVWQAIVLASVPAIAGAIALPGVRNLKVWQSFVLLSLTGAAITAVVVILAFRKFLVAVAADPYGY